MLVFLLLALCLRLVIAVRIVCKKAKVVIASVEQAMADPQTIQQVRIASWQLSMQLGHASKAAQHAHWNSEKSPGIPQSLYM